MYNKSIKSNKKRFTAVVAMLAVMFIGFLIVTCVLYNLQLKINGQIVGIYSQDITRQMVEKIEILFELKKNQLKTLVYEYDILNMKENDLFIQSLSMRDFGYLGYYEKNGKLTTVYGDANIQSRSGFDGGETVIAGANGSGEKFFFFFIEDSLTKTQFIGGIPADYFSKQLVFDNKTLSSFFIIDKKGFYVTNSVLTPRENYYDRVRELYEGNVGQYLSEIKTALEERKTYSLETFSGGNLINILITPLEKADFFLVTSTAETKIAEIIAKNLKIIFTVFVCTIFVIGLAIIGHLLYDRVLINKLIIALGNAKREKEEKTLFFASVSHDVRTPLNAITGMVKIALDNMQNPEKVKNSLKKIELSSKQLSALIENILMIGRTEEETIKFGPISIYEVIKNIVTETQADIKRKEQQFDVFIQDIISENVYYDNVALGRILMNLITNAVKYTPSKGRISVYIREERSSLGEGYTKIHFDVEDTGIGMTEEFQKIIFEKYAREKRDKSISGTGIGMMNVKKLVDASGGTIEIESEVDKGSCFHVTLDLKKVRSTEDMKLPEWNVLVVDDDEKLCAGAVSGLAELGVKTEWAVESRQAAKYIKDRHEENADYRFILIDLKCLDENIMQSIYKIRKQNKEEIPKILITGYNEDDAAGLGGSVKADGFILKPLFKSALYCGLMGVEGHHKDEKTEQDIDIDKEFLAGKQILLAEDIDINWEIVNEIFGSAGIKLERAENGLECKRKFENSVEGYYDAILMDIQMPVMDGFQATKEIRKSKHPDSKKIPIIAMSANAYDSDIEKCLACGMNAHIAKPIDIEKSYDLLKNVLKNKDGCPNSACSESL